MARFECLENNQNGTKVLASDNFTKKQLAILHVSVHYVVDDSIIYECPICRLKVKHRDMQYHLGRHWFDSNDCPLCSASPINRFHLVRHLMIHLDFKPYSCLKCKKTFKYQRDVLKHLRKSHHIYYKCPFCKKDFENYHSIKRHTDAHVRCNDSLDQDFFESCIDQVKNNNFSGNVSEEIQPENISENNAKSPKASNEIYSEIQVKKEVPSGDISSGEKLENITPRQHYSPYYSENPTEENEITKSEDFVDESECLPTKPDEVTENKNSNSSRKLSTQRRKRRKNSVLDARSHSTKLPKVQSPSGEPQGIVPSLPEQNEQRDTRPFQEKQKCIAVDYFPFREEIQWTETCSIEPEWILDGNDHQFPVALQYEKSVINDWMRMKLVPV